jgi:hypothetical protein
MEHVNYFSSLNSQSFRDHGFLILNDFFKDSQECENVKKLINEKLNDIIGSENTQALTYNRKSVYESKLNEAVKNWTVFPSIIYWTLLILWVGIVLIYLRNISFKTIGLLITLILYPYFSTDIILWVLSKIQMLWNFIFTAVNNRITA